MTLDLSSLKKAVNSLQRAVDVASKTIKIDVETDEQEVIRAGVIQNFEFTYELSWKFIKRWLKLHSDSQRTEGITRKELFRMAAQNRLIDDVHNWVEYHVARNETSHTYDNDKAVDVYRIALKFSEDAKKLLSILEQKND